LFTFRQAFTHGFSKTITLFYGFFSVLRTVSGTHLGILLEPVHWYFPKRNVLYYSIVYWSRKDH